MGTQLRRGLKVMGGWVVCYRNVFIGTFSVANTWKGPTLTILQNSPHCSDFPYLVICGNHIEVISFYTFPIKMSSCYCLVIHIDRHISHIRQRQHINVQQVYMMMTLYIFLHYFGITYILGVYLLSNSQIELQGGYTIHRLQICRKPHQFML